ncbi:hypothetical protein AAFF_G00220510 [Aldrovandia affinis]|uniref:Uncharacterized protein n=1 Tax=Aldrovandia affinis TaxID=143900 RepID=A0AAD7RG66_9TELE|nr:hypothetical protein AAFF_G00220510 [Aldrovandia affinis]
MWRDGGAGMGTKSECRTLTFLRWERERVPAGRPPGARWNFTSSPQRGGERALRSRVPNLRSNSLSPGACPPLRPPSTEHLCCPCEWDG